MFLHLYKTFFFKTYIKNIETAKKNKNTCYLNCYKKHKNIFTSMPPTGTHLNRGAPRHGITGMLTVGVKIILNNDCSVII